MFRYEFYLWVSLKTISRYGVAELTEVTTGLGPITWTEACVARSNEPVLSRCCEMLADAIMLECH